MITYLSTEGHSFVRLLETLEPLRRLGRDTAKNINHMPTAKWDMWIERTERGSAHVLIQGAIPVLIRTD
jgi:hypothetical protein